MNIQTFRVAVGSALVIVAVAPGRSPALNRAISDYATLISDLHDARAEVNDQKKIQSSEEKRKQLEKAAEDLEKKIEEEQEKLEELKHQKDFFGNIFGSDSCGGMNGPSAPAPPRPTPEGNGTTALTSRMLDKGETFPALHRAVSDYTKIASDLRELSGEIARQNGGSDEQRKQLAAMSEKLTAETARVRDAQNELRKMLDSLDNSFASPERNDSAPVRQRP